MNSGWPRAARAALLVPLVACTPHTHPSPTAADAAPESPPWVPEAEPEPRPGMVWIPAGVLLAGTPPDKLPRVADEEMAGEQVVMHGFYIDVFPYPNEPGAIPTTNMTQPEAAALCDGQGKRLCGELELERACKGEGNTTYEYGDTYKPAICGTGVARALTPTGVNATCRSAFGVHDLHGGVWSWTRSLWQRDPAKPGLVTVRGGTGADGELVARCANGHGQKPDTRREDLGVRCCAGEPNTFEVMLHVARGGPLRWQPPDDHIAPALEKLAPDEVRGDGFRAEQRFKVERTWTWHPLGNEEIIVGGGCARRVVQGEDKSCGIVIARIRMSAPVFLAWVPSALWQPTLHEADTPRELFLEGGDRNGAFRRRVSYAWGRIAVGEKERKKMRKGQKDPAY